MRTLLLFMVLVPFVLFGNRNAHAALFPVPVAQTVDAADLIAEGRVIHQYSFWNDRHTMIYTASTLDIYKVFKGTVSSSTVEVLTIGGVIGQDAIGASELVTLIPGDIGVFCLFPNQLAIKSPQTGVVLYDIYASAQGFIKYNLVDGSANAPFIRFATVTGDLYPMLEKETGSMYRSVKAYQPAVPKAALKGTSVTSFFPFLMRAGAHYNAANNVLTINGNNFGTPTGSATVYFDDAGDGIGGNLISVPYYSPLVSSWSSNQIVLRVPSNAGTGSFYVYNNLNSLAGTSPFPLAIDFSVTTYDFSDGNGPMEHNLMNTNGSGGYTLAYSNNNAGGGTAFSSSPARFAFQRAMDTHRELMLFNISLGAAVATQAVVNDGINVVQYDNTNTGVPLLPNGVLANCYWYVRKCMVNAGIQRSGFDIIVRSSASAGSAVSFATGPCPPGSPYTSYDLESVLLHELGHAAGLDHINDPIEGSAAPAVNPASVMNYASLPGTKRNSPDWYMLSGERYTGSTSGVFYSGCSAPGEMFPVSPMVAARDECGQVLPATIPLSGTTVAFDLVHATANKYTDPQFTNVNCSGTGTGVTNTQFYAFLTKPSGGRVTFRISGYTTNPVTQSACAGAGVELTLYQLTANTCPSGQSYPIAIGCRTFNGDSSLTSFNGLAGNTAYLLMADGIDNTKATFNLISIGTALPLKFTSFTGYARKQENVLNWTYEEAQNVDELYIERSRDGHSFEQIGTKRIGANGKGTFTDRAPIAGKGYYRLRVPELNGDVTYSQVISLVQSIPFACQVSPNPAARELKLEVQTIENGPVQVTMMNSIGALLQTKTFRAIPGTNNFPISLEGIPAGIYMLQIKSGAADPVALKFTKQ